MPTLPIQSFMSDPRVFLQSLVLHIPAILLALMLHEVAHGYVAYRLGDPTAKVLGRLSLNPLRHLDPMGTLFLIFVGFGWAKPVPINPNNFRHPRRDDFLVSIAGITTNLILFLVGCIALYAAVAVSMGRLQSEQWFMVDEKLMSRAAVVQGVFLGGFDLGQGVIQAAFNETAGFVFAMITYFARINLVLGVFNLLPIPPLDGYHVLNDLVLKRSLFATRSIASFGQLLLLALVITGALGTGLTFVITWSFHGVGAAFYSLFHAVGWA